MATIGIIADTHIPQRLPCLPDGIASVFRGVDLIMHAGDVNSPRVLTKLEALAPVVAVAGNADLFQHGLPLTRVVEIDGKHIGLVHGHGGWFRYLLGKVRDQVSYSEEYYLKIVKKSFEQVDAIVFGHTHRVYQAVRAGVLMFNPGPVAPTYYHTDGPQVGLMYITSQAITTEIIRV